MEKSTYRAKSVKELDLEAMSANWPEDVVMGIDVAKDIMYAVFMDPEREVLASVRWKHLEESAQVVSWVAGLSCVREVAMEPSGTYGDALRGQLEAAGLEVYRVHPKQVKDAREIYDGVPSNHDPKASAIIAWLHRVGRSARWELNGEARRGLKAKLQLMQIYDHAYQHVLHLLEAQLARHWPEVLGLLDLSSVGLLGLLADFGSPAAMASQRSSARRSLEQASHHSLKLEKIEAVMDSAAQTLGLPMTEVEVQCLQELAREGRRRYRDRQEARQRLARFSKEEKTTAQLARRVGSVTAAVVVGELGPLTDYPHRGGLLKAAGLNLKEVSSGRRQGQLALSKRGSGRLRQYLYLAVLRWIQKDRWARAWFEQKVQRQGGLGKRKALVALMRKLLCGLWWVAKGERFDSRKLFDTRRLRAAGF